MDFPIAHEYVEPSPSVPVIIKNIGMIIIVSLKISEIPQFSSVVDSATVPLEYKFPDNKIVTGLIKYFFKVTKIS